MSSKDIKSLLKEAREAIKNKDFNASLKLCKTILKEDKENYMALVFLGLSLQETGPADNAPKAFRKAIQTNFSNVLAWNGLASYYEKVDTAEAKKDLLNVYMILLTLNKEEKKQNELFEKALTLAPHLKDTTVIAEAFYKVVKNAENSTELINMGWNYLISYLSQLEELPQSLIPMYDESLKMKVTDAKLVTKDQYLEYLKLLHKQSKDELLLEESLKMSNVFEDDKLSLEWFCKTYNKLAIEKDDAAKKFSENVNGACEKLLSIDPQSSMGQFTRSLILFESDSVVDAKNLLQEVTTLRPGLLYAWVLLCNSYLKLQFYSDGIEAAKKADRLLQSINNSNERLRKILDSHMMELYSRSEVEDHWKEGLKLCEALSEKEPNKLEIISSRVRIHINSGKYEEAKTHLSKLKDVAGAEALWRVLSAQLLKKQGDLQGAFVILQEGLGSNLNVAEFWLELGLLNLDLGKFDMLPFLKAAKLEPNSYLCYLHMGNYYNKFNNHDKARRCYEKAFRLNPKCQEAGIELSKVYKKLKKWDSNLNLLESLTGGKIIPSNKWAYLQLGLHYLEHEEYSKAIDSLRILVRSDPENCHYWEALADAYMARGAYNSALKCYQKAVEIEEDSLYPILQIANIKKMLSQFEEAKTDFKSILLTNKKYVPALKGLAETCMNQARHYKKLQLLGLTRDCAQDALDNVTIALEQNSDMSCLWKIAADSCNLVAQLPQSYSCLLVLSAFVEGKNLQGNRVVEQNELFTLASRCYCKALSLVEDNVLLWHDLAACYLTHGLNVHDKEEANQLFRRAQASIEQCININPTYWQHWNLLGVIAFHNEPKNFNISQHSFIKAVTLEHNSAISWCNLGTLYFHVGDVKLANKAFSQAQRADPNYVNSWVGQALLAETLGHEDAMDLFRHSTLLGHLQESALGYGHWVCQTILENPPHAIIYSIHNMHAVPVACDALTWYTENNPDNSCAWNMLGLLRERMGLKTSAEQAFKSALSLAEDKDRDKAYINYGRLLMKLGQHSKAVNIFKSVREGTFNSVSGLALALFKDEQFEESYESYESALHWMTEEQVLQSDLLVALASMAYLFQGTDAAKTLLFQSTQLKPRSPWGLYATLALGLLHEDLNLAMLVLKEFVDLRDDKRCLPHIAVLTSYTYLMQNEYDKAIRELSRLVHRHPDQGSLWLTLAIVLLRLQSQRKSSTVAAAKCAHRAMKLGQANMDVTKVLCMVSLASYLVGDYKEALKNAQNAIHTYPNIAESWAVLVATLTALQNKKKNEVKYRIKDKIVYIQDYLNPSPALDSWLNQQSSKIKGR